MLARKIYNVIEQHFVNKEQEIILVDGSRQVGKTRRIYDLIPSNMENKKKRVVIKDITEKKGKTVSDYQEEFEYLISSGIALSVNAITNPSYPLISSGTKNLLKLYMNDVGF